MRYRAALFLHRIARWLNPDAGISVVVDHHNGLETVQVDLHGNRLRGTWEHDERHCKDCDCEG